MTEPRGLLTPPPPPQLGSSPSNPLCCPGVCQRGVCSKAGVAVHIKDPLCPPLLLYTPCFRALGLSLSFWSGAGQLCTSLSPRPTARSIVWPWRKTIISTQFTVSKHWVIRPPVQSLTHTHTYTHASLIPPPWPWAVIYPANKSPPSARCHHWL